MGETAQRLARRYPGQAETMVRQLGPEGLTAVRVFGDDVAEVLVKEGPESLDVLRKTGRGGWSFFTDEVLPHKKKLAAAGVLAAFLANPDKFVDYAGQATEFAVREFARAGVQLAARRRRRRGPGPRVVDRRGPRRPRSRSPSSATWAWSWPAAVAIAALFVLARPADPHARSADQLADARD